MSSLGEEGGEEMKRRGDAEEGMRGDGEEGGGEEEGGEEGG